MTVYSVDSQEVSFPVDEKSSAISLKMDVTVETKFCGTATFPYVFEQNAVSEASQTTRFYLYASVTPPPPNVICTIPSWPKTYSHTLSIPVTENVNEYIVDFSRKSSEAYIWKFNRDADGVWSVVESPKSKTPIVVNGASQMSSEKMKEKLKTFSDVVGKPVVCLSVSTSDCNAALNKLIGLNQLELFKSNHLPAILITFGFFEDHLPMIDAKGTAQEMEAFLRRFDREFGEKVHAFSDLTGFEYTSDPLMSKENVQAAMQTLMTIQKDRPQLMEKKGVKFLGIHISDKFSKSFTENFFISIDHRAKVEDIIIYIAAQRLNLGS